MKIEEVLNNLKLIEKEFPSKIYSFNEILDRLGITAEWIFKIKQNFTKNETYINDDEIIWKILDFFFNEYLEKIDIECGPESKEFRNLTDELNKVYGCSYTHLYGIQHSEIIKEWEYSYDVPKVGDKKQKLVLTKTKK